MLVDCDPTTLEAPEALPFPPDVSYGGVHFNSRPDLHRNSFWYPTIRFRLKPLIVAGMVSTLAPRIRFDRLDGRIMDHHLILNAPSLFRTPTS